ncbi:MAG: substrate-binding domain-containing protein [Pseudomonadaceae bacterium]|nr:substrate-binding domain-containing protein [Pseudomonadaceae bacterium]
MYQRIRTWSWSLLLLSAGASAQERCVSLVTSAGGQSFWSQVRQSAEQAADELDIPLYARGPSRDGDSRVQLELIERMLKFECKVLIVAPNGPEVGRRMAELKKLGVLGLYVDRDLGGNAVQAAIATDNRAAGRHAGTELARLLGGQGRVAVLRLDERVQSTSERERGFIEGARAGGLQVVLDRYLPLSDPRAMAELGEQLKRLDGLFTPSEGTTLEVLAALRRLKLAGRLAHIGFDSSPLLIDALQRDEIAGLMVQQPRLLGSESVARARRLLDGDLSGPRQVNLPARYVDSRNLDDEEVQRLLAP